MRIAVTGTQGQLVRCLTDQAHAHGNVSIITLGRPDVDLTEPADIKVALRAAKADFVINAAAYTAVDLAETDRDAAFALNCDAAAAVAISAHSLGLPVIQVSTDYVFDGRSDSPYTPEDRTNPLSVYGASKLAGEMATRAANSRHLVIRTAWVYSAYGNNFVKTMLRLASDREEIHVVDDQVGNPTSAHDLAGSLLTAAQTALRPDFTAWGTYHMAGQNVATWADLAEHVFAQSAQLSGPSARVVRIPGSAYKTPAPRPANSRLNCRTSCEFLGYSATDWRTSAASVVSTLLRSGVV